RLRARARLTTRTGTTSRRRRQIAPLRGAGVTEEHRAQPGQVARLAPSPEGALARLLDRLADVAVPQQRGVEGLAELGRRRVLDEEVVAEVGLHAPAQE